MALGYHLNQVGGDADSISRAERGAFQKRIHLELPRDLRQRFRRLPVADHRLVREHLQAADLAQLGNQRLRHPFRKVVLRGVAREVFQRQHRNGRDFARYRPADQPVAQPAHIQSRSQSQQQQSGRRPPHYSLPAARGRSLHYLQLGAAVVPPSANLGLIGVDRSLPLMRAPMDR